MSEEISAYPLCWPAGWPRTPAYKRTTSRFGKWQGYGAARSTRHKEVHNLLHEIRLLKGKDAIISSNLALRQDGLPYSKQPRTDDSGMAVYFTYGERKMCFACDRYKEDWENLRAIALTINALRGIERWGASDMMERAFTGFMALPSMAIGEAPWYETLGVPESSTIQEAEAAYREKAKKMHPDVGGNEEDMMRLNRARDRAKEVLGAPV